MPAPTFIQEAETAWDTTTSPKTTASFSVLAGDVLVAYSIQETQTGTLSVSGGSLTWTTRQTIAVSAYTQVIIATAVVDTNKSMTCSFSATGGVLFGGNCLTFRGSDGVGASAQNNNASGSPTLAITTTAANSALVVANGDWNAIDGASRQWDTSAGVLNEQTYYFNSVAYAAYGGYHSDAGAAGAKTVGIATPSGQKYSIVAVEVLGTAGGRTPKNTHAWPLGMNLGMHHWHNG